jgi:GST-like protein
MIDCYTWATPNGHKVHIMLEETGLEYAVHGINIRAGDQFEEAFLKISPNNRIPAIIDRDGPGGNEMSLFETGAILLYLGDKTGQFLPRLEDDAPARYATIQWLMLHVKRLIKTMVYKVGCVTLYRNVSHPVSQF